MSECVCLLEITETALTTLTKQSGLQACKACKTCRPASNKSLRAGPGKVTSRAGRIEKKTVLHDSNISIRSCEIMTFFQNINVKPQKQHGRNNINDYRLTCMHIAHALKLGMLELYAGNQPN